MCAVNVRGQYWHVPDNSSLSANCARCTPPRGFGTNQVFLSRAALTLSWNESTLYRDIPSFVEKTDCRWLAADCLSLFDGCKQSTAPQQLWTSFGGPFVCVFVCVLFVCVYVCVCLCV